MKGYTAYSLFTLFLIVLPAITMNDLSIFAPVSIILEKFISLRFWSFVTIIVLSYVLGHLLYRQDPKEPDYVSFINIREKIMGYNPWVIEKGDGLTRSDVQFPYSNLAQYLSARGFHHLSRYIYWKPRQHDEDESGRQRSKAFINKLKTRISFFFPESTLNIIRNEAHIRLASSMWYGSKYMLNLTYLSVATTAILVMIMRTNLPNDIKQTYPLTSIILSILALILLLIAVVLKFRIEKIIIKNEEDKKKNVKSSISTIPIEEREERIRNLTNKFRLIFKIHDRTPFISSLLLVSACYLIWKNDVMFMKELIPLVFVYITIIFFLFLGILFVKHRIEQSFHYQRVREIIYVLETSYLAKVLGDDKINILWSANVGFEKKREE